MIKKIGTPVKRVDAAAKSSGETKYLSDLEFPGLLYAKALRSERGRAKIVDISVPELPEGYYYIDKTDIPDSGVNKILMIKDDWPVFADGQVRYIGEVIALVVGPDRQKILEILDGIKVSYEDLEPVFTIEEALALKGGPLHGTDNLYADYHLEKGDPEAAFAAAPQSYDVLITDISMPGIDGITLVEGALMARPDLAVVLMSGLAGELQRAETLKSKKVRMVSKPVTLDQIRSEVRAVIAA